MMPGHQNAVLRHLPAVGGETAKMSASIATLGIGVTAIRGHRGGVVTMREHDRGEVAACKQCLGRIESRLDMTG